MKIKKQKTHKSVSQKENLNLKILKSNSTWTDIDSIKKDHKEFIKNNKSILKTHKTFKSEKNNVSMKKLTRLLEVQMMIHAIKWFNRNICIWNK